VLRSNSHRGSYTAIAFCSLSFFLEYPSTRRHWSDARADGNGSRSRRSCRRSGAATPRGCRRCACGRAPALLWAPEQVLSRSARPIPCGSDSWRDEMQVVAHPRTRHRDQLVIKLEERGIQLGCAGRVRQLRHAWRCGGHPSAMKRRSVPSDGRCPRSSL